MSCAWTFALMMAAGPAAAQSVWDRMEQAAAIVDQLRDRLETRLTPEDAARVDCAIIVPRFYRGAVVSGEVFRGGFLLETSFGRGFISCRRGTDWSAPAGVTLEGGRRTVQIGESFDVMILLTKKEIRDRILSGRFVIDSRFDPDIKLFTLARSKARSEEIDFNGAVLQSDSAVNRVLYGRPITTAEVVEGRIAVPGRAQTLLSKLSPLFSR
jgi:lipid-binding SYLF domain-containing protein